MNPTPQSLKKSERRVKAAKTRQFKSSGSGFLPDTSLSENNQTKGNMSGFNNGFIDPNAVERAREAGRQLIQQENSNRARDKAERDANGQAHPTTARAKTLDTVRNHKPLVDWSKKGWAGSAGVQ